MAASEVDSAAPASAMNIGDVITGLASEFPDVTVSKIRYLESYGLLEPERSPAGYRLFSVDEVARLTWILRQQRDHFLPLKVIRSMLLDGVDLADSGPEESADVRPFRESGRTGNLGSVSVSLEELAAMGGLDVEVVRDLEKHGLIVGIEAGRTVVYDGDALLVARVAARFVQHGFDVRHLRMYLVAAQREAGILEQVLLPLRRRGDGRSGLEARRLLDELADAGAALHDLLLRRSMGPLV
ncbi:MAG: transcriptional regulator FtsR [Acidimicrobiales bacterium]